MCMRAPAVRQAAATAGTAAAERCVEHAHCLLALHDCRPWISLSTSSKPHSNPQLRILLPAAPPPPPHFGGLSSVPLARRPPSLADMLPCAEYTVPCCPPEMHTASKHSHYCAPPPPRAFGRLTSVPLPGRPPLAPLTRATCTMCCCSYNSRSPNAQIALKDPPPLTPPPPLCLKNSTLCCDNTPSHRLPGAAVAAAELRLDVLQERKGDPPACRLWWL
jgi:hypothetical protein